MVDLDPAKQPRPPGGAPDADALQGALNSARLEGAWGSIRPAPPARRWVLHADPADAPAFAQAWGAPLPAMLRGEAANGRAALRLGPDEWLLLADPADAGPAFAAGLPPCSLVEVSDRQLGWELAGSGIRDLLAAGCPLDLRDRAFPPGSATRTLFGKVEIVLWRHDDGGAPAFRLEAWRSYARYLHRFFAEAAA